MKTRLFAAAALLGLSAWFLGACSILNAPSAVSNTSGAVTTVPARATTAKIGSLPPEIDLKSMTGDQITLSKLQGHAVLVNFWATWCGPCREEFPALVRKYKQYQDQGFIVLGVNTQDENSDSGVLTFMRNTLVNFPVVRDPGDQLSRAYRVNGLPTSFFIDRSGILRDTVVGGPMTDDFLDKEFAKINQ